MSRLTALQDADKPIDVPPPGLAWHLVSYLMEAGPVAHTGMGMAALSHAELAAWQANTGTELTAWEARTLRRLSGDYAATASLAREADCPPPYLPTEMDEDRRAEVGRQVRAAFGGRAKVH